MGGASGVHQLLNRCLPMSQIAAAAIRSVMAITIRMGLGIGPGITKIKNATPSSTETVSFNSIN